MQTAAIKKENNLKLPTIKEKKKSSHVRSFADDINNDVIFVGVFC